jgi:hypothetical protein
MIIGPAAMHLGGPAVGSEAAEEVITAGTFPSGLRKRRSDAFRPSECSKFLIDTKIEGIERLYHLKEPRVDPVYRREYGLTELPCGKTMGDYLKAFEDPHIESLHRLNQRFSDHLVRKAFRRAEQRAERMEAEEPAPPRSESWREVIERDQEGRIKVGIDYDSSCMTVYRRLRNSSQKKLLEEEKYDIYAYLTNYEGSLWERFKFCVGRCTVEKCIRESKLGFDWHHLPCAEFSANRAYLGHVQLAYNLMISFRLTALGGDAARWSADTVRRRLLAIPGRFGPGNPDILHLPKWWPHRHHLRHACRELTDFKS